MSPPPKPKTVEEAEAQGWKRCFVAEEPRLSEMMETYAELGFEVVALPVDLEPGACNACLAEAPDRVRVIYTWRRDD